MLGFNGGLLGTDRTTSTGSSVPGIWTLGEQVKAKRSFLWPANQGDDPYFANVSLLLKGDGTNGSTTFVDSSSNNFTITPAGNAQISTTQSKFGGASMYFDGGSVLTVPTDNAFTLDADFTIEWWSWKSTNGYYDGVIGASSGNSNFIELSSSRNVFMIVFSNGGGVSYGPYNPNDSTWHHYAVTRSGTTVRLYIDGTQVASGTQSASFSFTFIGQYSNYWYNGYIDDLRITKGVARYTSNFTPPTAAFPDV